jgi:hypothetical protein
VGGRARLGALALVTLGATGVVRAQEPQTRAESAPTAEPTPRPRFRAAVGAGAAFEASTGGMPAFFATGGVGADSVVGLELGAISTAVSGVSAGAPQTIDRLGLDAYAVVQPGAGAQPGALTLARDDGRLGARLLRACGLELGLGLERDGLGTRSGSRWGLHTGARVEIPLSVAGGASEVRVRLAARRLVGLYTPRLGTTDVGDDFQLLAAVVSVF